MVTSYVTNNNGSMPTKISKLWLNSKGKDPDDVDYTETNVVNCTSASDCKAPTDTSAISRNANQVYVFTAATCENGAIKFKTGKRNFAIYGYIENGANNAGTYCLASNA